jgi:hypothetical protein
MVRLMALWLLGVVALLLTVGSCGSSSKPNSDSICDRYLSCVGQVTTENQEKMLVCTRNK